MITPQSAKAKGNLLEAYIARRIREIGLDRLAMKMPGSGSGQFKGDVNTKMKVLGRQAVIEAKNQKNLHIQEWWIQTERQTLSYGEPILAFKLYREPLEATKVVIYLDTFLELVKRSSEPKIQEQDREFRGELNNSKKAVSVIERRLK
jgi:hypothetical protein